MDVIFDYIVIIGNFIVYLLELFGIVTIALGSIQSLVLFIKSGFDFSSRETRIVLGDSLALSLQIMLGAEIIKTIVVRDLRQLIILAVIVVIRVALSLLIHWEVEQAEKIED